MIGRRPTTAMLMFRPAPFRHKLWFKYANPMFGSIYFCNTCNFKRLLRIPNKPIEMSTDCSALQAEGTALKLIHVRLQKSGTVPIYCEKFVCFYKVMRYAPFSTPEHSYAYYSYYVSKYKIVMLTLSRVFLLHQWLVVTDRAFASFVVHVVENEATADLLSLPTVVYLLIVFFFLLC